MHVCCAYLETAGNNSWLVKQINCEGEEFVASALIATLRLMLPQPPVVGCTRTQLPGLLWQPA